MTKRAGYSVATHETGILITDIFPSKRQAANLVRDLMRLDAQTDAESAAAFRGTYVVVEVRS